MSQKPGRRKLKQQLAAAKAAAKYASAAMAGLDKRWTNALAERQAAIQRAEKAERELKERASVLDAIKGFDLRIIPEDYIRRMPVFRLSIEIVPEAYRIAFDYGGGDQFRDVSRYCRCISLEMASKIERELLDHFQRITR